MKKKIGDLTLLSTLVVKDCHVMYRNFINSLIHNEKGNSTDFTLCNRRLPRYIQKLHQFSDAVMQVQQGISLCNMCFIT